MKKIDQTSHQKMLFWHNIVCQDLIYQGYATFYNGEQIHRLCGNRYYNSVMTGFLRIKRKQFWLTALIPPISKRFVGAYWFGPGCRSVYLLGFTYSQEWLEMES